MDNKTHEILLRIESRLTSLESTVGTLRKLTWVAVSSLMVAVAKMVIGA